MAEVYRGAGAVVAAGVVAEAVGAVVIPGDGEGFKCTGVELASDLAGGLPADVAVQQSINTGGAWADIFRARLGVANGTMDISDMRMVCGSPTNLKQARGATALQYRLVVYPGTIADVYHASMRGRTER